MLIFGRREGGKERRKKGWSGLRQTLKTTAMMMMTKVMMKVVVVTVY